MHSPITPHPTTTTSAASGAPDRRQHGGPAVEGLFLSFACGLAVGPTEAALWELGKRIESMV